jgi:hypothetical protein
MLPTVSLPGMTSEVRMPLMALSLGTTSGKMIPPTVWSLGMTREKMPRPTASSPGTTKRPSGPRMVVTRPTALSPGTTRGPRSSSQHLEMSECNYLAVLVHRLTQELRIRDVKENVQCCCLRTDELMAESSSFACLRTTQARKRVISRVVREHIDGRPANSGNLGDGAITPSCKGIGAL